MMPDNNCKHTKVSWLTVVRSFLSNCENQVLKLLLSVFLFVAIMLIKHFFLFNTCGFDISNIYVTIFSNLLGFAIAGYAILLSLGKEIVCILLEPFEEGGNEADMENDKKNPFQILSATFTYCCIILLITNLIILFFNHNNYYLMIVYFFCSYSIILVGDLINHLYSTTYYLKEYKGKCKEKKDENITNNNPKE